MKKWHTSITAWVSETSYDWLGSYPYKLTLTPGPVELFVEKFNIRMKISQISRENILSYIRYGRSQVVNLTGSVTILSRCPSRPCFRSGNTDSAIRAGRAELKQRDNSDVHDNRLQTVAVDRSSLRQS